MLMFNTCEILENKVSSRQYFINAYTKIKYVNLVFFPFILRGLRAGFSEAVPHMITAVQEEERGGESITNSSV